MQTSLWLLSFFHFFFASSICFICSIESNFVSSSTPTDIKSHYALLCQNSLDLIFYLYWQWVNSTVGWIPPRPGWNCSPSAAGREQASVMPLVYLKVRIVFVLTILTTYLPSWPAAPRGTYEEEASDSDDSLSVSCLLTCVHFFFFFFLSVKKWKAFQGLICPIVHLLLTKVYSLLLAQHLPWILAVTFPLEDAFVM